MNEAVGRKGGGSGEEENVPEKEDSMCKGLGAGMSLPRTETLEHRPALPAPHLPATQVADQVKKKISHWLFRTMHLGCFHQWHLNVWRCPGALPGHLSWLPLALVSAGSSQGVQAVSPHTWARWAGFPISGPSYPQTVLVRAWRCVPGNGRS